MKGRATPRDRVFGGRVRLMSLSLFGVLASLVANDVQATPITVLDSGVFSEAAAVAEFELELTREMAAVSIDLDALGSSMAELAPGAPAAWDMTPWHLPAAADAASGETLAEVLRSLTIEHSDPFGRQPRAAPERSYIAARPVPENDDGGQWLGWRETILESSSAGSMLRSMVDVRASGDSAAGFSVFGLGNFALETTSGGGGLVLTDLDHSMTLPISAAPLVRYENDTVAPPVTTGPGAGYAIFRFFRSLANFTSSPLGIVLEVLAALLWGCAVVFRTIAVFRGTGPGRARVTLRRSHTGHKVRHRRRRRHRLRRRRRTRWTAA